MKAVDIIKSSLEDLDKVRRTVVDDPECGNNGAYCFVLLCASAREHPWRSAKRERPRGWHYELND